MLLMQNYHVDLIIYHYVKCLLDIQTLYLYLDVWFKVSPRQSMRYALVDIVERLLENSGTHVLLFLVLV